MNQSESTHSPSVLYRDGGGWSGGNDRFRVVENVIKIKKSDGYPNIVPTEQQRVKMYDQFGNFSQHVQLYNTDPVFQLWMNKIAPYLADWVLDKRNDPTALIVPWKLIYFPAGYTLWSHLTGDIRDPANPRVDAYLYGSPNKIFRSPMEFVEHAIWLMKDGPSTGLHCLCKYCTPGQNQLAINRRLNRRGDDDGADEEDSGDGAAVNAARFRNRHGASFAAAILAGARARREPRARSPVSIMAKDYRVGTGNTTNGRDGGGSGA